MAVHLRGVTTGASAAAAVDEAVTGGLLGNLYGLLDGLFTGDQTSRHAKDYAEHLLQGGAVVSVRLADAVQQPEIDRLMDALGCRRRTGWSATTAA